MDSVVETLLDLARAQPDRPLLLTRGRTYDYAGFVGRAGALASDLVARGLPRAARVALLADEYDDFFVAMVAVWLAGGVVVPLNTTLPPDDLDGLLAKATPTLLVRADGAGPAGFAPGAVETVRVAAAELDEGGGSPGVPAGHAPVGPDELAMVMFTSGTTGLPKGVCQTLRAIGGNAGLVAATLGLTAGDRIFINTPPYFTSGICHFLTLLANGGSTAGRQGFFFGEALLDELAGLGCTGFGGAPAHLVRVVEPLDGPRPVPGLRFWVSSGDHLPLDVIDHTARVLPGVRLFNMYGLTEVSGRLCVLPPAELERRRGSVGRPIGTMRVTPRLADGAAAPPGTTGELYVDGPLLMRGYLDEPAITAASLTADGFRTGDFGHVDQDGFVWVEGRRDDIIKRGGEKVSIVHIQQALRALDLFSDVAVLAVDDEILGHVPVAFVVPVEPAVFSRTKTLRALKRVLPATSMPSRLVAVAEVPRTGSGKAIRAELLRLAGDER
ncbi:MAG TPA: class I adenylate-forming enzyme family protein [Thermoleophilia bacterium]|nr:class I adenylate-forming enzyme family protein [Thermoleophilia bacterium]